MRLSGRVLPIRRIRGGLGAEPKNDPGLPRSANPEDSAFAAKRDSSQAPPGSPRRRP